MGALILRPACSPEVGIGHFMRCLALAEAWMIRGGTAHFVLSKEASGMSGLAVERGATFEILQTSYPASSLEADMNEFRRIRAVYQDASWCILDGYVYTSEYQQAILDVGFRILVIDDSGFPISDRVQVILNQNIGETSERYPNVHAKLLLGTDYTLLRGEFLRRGRSSVRIIRTPPRLLVTMGGSDPVAFTEKILVALKNRDLEGLDFAIIVGRANPRISSIRDFMQKKTSRGQLVIAPSDVSEWMEWADIAISAAGTTVWELLYTGLPFATVALADNQRPTAEELDRRTLAPYWGWHGDLDAMKILSLLKELVAQGSSLNTDLVRRQAQVDGKGRDRVLDVLESIH